MTKTTPEQLVSAVRAALDETERYARAAGYHRWRPDFELDIVVAVSNGKTVARDCRDYDSRHIARHDPAAVLRRVAADRRVLERHQESTDTEYGSWCRRCCVGEWPCADVLDLARGLGIDPEETT